MLARRDHPTHSRNSGTQRERGLLGEEEEKKKRKKKKSRTARTKDGPAGNNARPVIGWAGKSRDHTRGSQSRDPIPNRHDDFDSKTATSPPAATLPYR